MRAMARRLMGLSRSVISPGRTHPRFSASSRYSPAQWPEGALPGSGYRAAVRMSLRASPVLRVPAAWKVPSG